LKSTFRIAFRNIVRQGARTWLTLAAIALGVATLVLSGGFVEDILGQLREATIHSQLGHLQVYRSGQFDSGGQRPFDFLIEQPRAVDRTIESLPGVVARGHRLNFSGLLGNGKGELPIIGEGVEPGPEARIGSALSILAGRNLVPADSFAAVIGEGLANAMKVNVGERVTCWSARARAPPTPWISRWSASFAASRRNTMRARYACRLARHSNCSTRPA
jgi:putative ABC transport system permease protein